MLDLTLIIFLSIIMFTTPNSFETQVGMNQATLVLTGMSNTGKSYQADRLEQELGFARISCDELIGDVLTSEGLPTHDITALAEWMGQPPDPHFEANESYYRELEIAVMHGILNLAAEGFDTNTVIDTSGSVVHTNEAISNGLGQIGTVVHLAASDKTKQHLYRSYLHTPKPVVWSGHYAPNNGESPDTTLERCYNELLIAREGLYAAISDISLPASEVRQLPTATAFIDTISTALQKSA